MTQSTNQCQAGGSSLSHCTFGETEARGTKQLSWDLSLVCLAQNCRFHLSFNPLRSPTVLFRDLPSSHRAWPLSRTFQGPRNGRREIVFERFVFHSFHPATLCLLPAFLSLDTHTPASCQAFEYTGLPACPDAQCAERPSPATWPITATVRPGLFNC